MGWLVLERCFWRRLSGRQTVLTPIITQLVGRVPLFQLMSSQTSSPSHHAGYMPPCLSRLAPAPGICPLVSHDWPPRRVYASLSHTIGPRAG
eukprot:683598-Pyramimonas_sp.AAC.1